MIHMMFIWVKQLKPGALRAIYHHDTPKQRTKTALQLTFAPVQLVVFFIVANLKKDTRHFNRIALTF